MLTLSEVVNWLKEQGKAFWPGLAQLNKQSRTEARKENERDEMVETEDYGVINKKIQEEKAREKEDEGLEVMASERIDEENHVMEERGLKKCKRVENVAEVVAHGIEERQETKRMNDFEVGMILEGGESESKKRKVVTDDKKLVKKHAKKGKGEKRRVRQRRAKQLKNNFLSTQPKTQGNISLPQSASVTEKQTTSAITELKSEVLVIGQTTKEIDRKLQISLHNQVFTKLTLLVPKASEASLGTFYFCRDCIT